MRLTLSLLGHEQMTLKTHVIFNHSRIALEFQSDGRVVPVLPRVTGGRIKKFIMGFSTRRLSMKLFQVAGRKCRAWLFQVYPHFGDLYWSTLGCWNLPAFATVLSPKSALKARQLDMHVLQNGLVFIRTCRQFSSHRLKKETWLEFSILTVWFFFLMTVVHAL